MGIFNMTDNYQFDKNSKLFQKFLAMKANKNNESGMQKGQTEEVSVENIQKNLSAPYRIPQKHSKRDKSKSIQGQGNSLQGPLHVTIDDIQEAASEALKEEAVNESQYTEIEEIKTKTEVRMNLVTQEKEKPVNELKKEAVTESEVQNVMPKNDRTRERRTREFKQRPRIKEQRVEEIQITQVEPTVLPKVQEDFKDFGVSFKPTHTVMELQNQNREPNFIEGPNDKLEEINFTLGSKQGQYRKKYQRLSHKYEEIKETLQQQRKKHQLFQNQKESEVDLLKEKYQQLRSIEDTLATDLKRYKDKFQSESIMRTKFQEEVKELNFRIIELEEILEGKETNLKKKTDEIAHWKAQNEQLRSQMKEYYAQVQTFEEKCKFLESEGKIVHKDVSHKEQLIEELRKNISTLIQENNIAKDELYKLTIKLYHLQQENMSLRADVLRRENQQPQNISAIQDNYLRTLTTMSPQRNKENPQKSSVMTQNNEPRDSVPRRRRQFARERAVTKPEPAERITQHQQRRQRRTNHPERQPRNIDNNAKEIAARIEYLQKELEIRNKQKAMNGRLRKQRIQLERQLIALQNQQFQ